MAKKLNVTMDAAHLRAIMARADLSQRDLARMSGINVNTILALTKGRQVPHVSTLARIVGAINLILEASGQTPINPVDLYLTEGFPKESTPISSN